jgi:hypothetical protein
VITAAGKHTMETDRITSYLSPPSLVPHGQPPRPNTAVQYHVFNPDLPRLQSSPSPLHAPNWSNILRHYPGNPGSIIAGILPYGVQIGYRGKKQFCHSTNHYIYEPGVITAKLAEDPQPRSPLVGLWALPCFTAWVSPPARWGMAPHPRPLLAPWIRP